MTYNVQSQLQILSGSNATLVAKLVDDVGDVPNSNLSANHVHLPWKALNASYTYAYVVRAATRSLAVSTAAAKPLKLYVRGNNCSVCGVSQDETAISYIKLP